MASTKCADCRARVRKAETRCNNCGAVNWKALGRVPFWRAVRWGGALLGGGLGAWLGFAVLAPVGKLAAFGLAALLAGGGLVQLLRRREGGCLTGGLGVVALASVLLIPASVWPVGAAVLAGLLLGWLGGKLTRTLLARLLVRRGGRTLRESKKIVSQRLRELKSRLRRLRILQREVPGTPRGELSDAAEQALHEGEARLHEQLARYRAQDWRTEYARWRNEVVALAEDADERAVDSKTVGELKLLDDAGRRLLAELRADAEAMATEEGTDGFVRLQESIGALENLRQKVMLLVALSEAVGGPDADATAFDAAAAEPRIFEALHGGADEEADLFADLAKLEAEHAALRAQLDSRLPSTRDQLKE